MLIFGKRQLQKLCIQTYIRPGASIRVTPILELPIFFVKIERGHKKMIKFENLAVAFS